MTGSLRCEWPHLPAGWLPVEPPAAPHQLKVAWSPHRGGRASPLLVKVALAGRARARSGFAAPARPPWRRRGARQHECHLRLRAHVRRVRAPAAGTRPPSARLPRCQQLFSSPAIFSLHPQGRLTRKAAAPLLGVFLDEYFMPGRSARRIPQLPALPGLVIRRAERGAWSQTAGLDPRPRPRWPPCGRAV